MRSSSDSPTAAPLAVVGAITFLNSLGSGLLWSGAFFVTEQSFQWSEAQNFMLALGATVVYAVAAFMSGRVVRALDARASTRRVIAMLMVLQMIGGALAFAGPVGVVACVLIASGASATLWPIMEAYLSAARHGHDLRRSIGLFNLTWMGAVGVALLLMAPAIAFGYAAIGLALFVPISGFSILLLRWLPARPPPHVAESPLHRHRPERERELRDATRVLLPVGYILIGALGPAMPFLLGALDVEPGWRTPVTAVWMASRLVTVALLIRFSFWHGRAWTLAMGFLLATGGFATIALAQTLPIMLLGLACFGAGQAVIYYAALYYAMVVGGAEVHAGGIFETLIGLGYGVGPIVGLVVGTGVGYVWGVLGISVAITGAAIARMAAAKRFRGLASAAPRAPE